MQSYTIQKASTTGMSLQDMDRREVAALVGRFGRVQLERREERLERIGFVGFRLREAARLTCQSRGGFQ